MAVTAEGAVLSCYLGYKILRRFSHKNRDKREVLTNPGCDIDTEYSATASNRIWRNILRPMHREQKCEMLVASKPNLAVYCYGSSINLEESLATESRGKKAGLRVAGTSLPWNRPDVKEKWRIRGR